MYTFQKFKSFYSRYEYFRSFFTSNQNVSILTRYIIVLYTLVITFSKYCIFFFFLHIVEMIDTKSNFNLEFIFILFKCNFETII